MILKGYMALNKDMINEENNIKFEIGKSYEHDRGYRVFGFYITINHIAESDVNLSEYKLIEVSVDDKELIGSNGYFKSNNITILREVPISEIMYVLQTRLRNISSNMINIRGLVNKTII